MKLFFLFNLIFSVAVFAQERPPIGTIDFYGLGKISEQRVREVLPVKVGDVIKSSADIKKIEQSLAEKLNVAEVQLGGYCCTNDGKTAFFVGVRAKNIPPRTFRPAPKGTVRLTAEIIKTGDEFTAALRQAVSKGDASEDDSAGHSLMNNPEAHLIQQKYIPLANGNLSLLRRVIRESADAEHRAVAAEVIAYADDKAKIVEDLLYATKDSDSKVRNNAMRALAIIAGYAQKSPEKNIRVPYEPFVEPLDSIDWTDRNKSAFALMRLTEKRDARLLKLLKAHSLPALFEMAQWRSAGHANAPLIILARVAGISEEEIGRAVVSNDRASLIEKARQNLK